MMDRPLPSPPADLIFQRGDFVLLTGAGRTVKSFVALASPNGASLMLMFDAMIGGYVGMMPVLFRDGQFHGVMDDLLITLTRYPEDGP